MINSLSQKLCKICGITEQKIIVTGFDEFDITMPIFKTINQGDNEPCVRIVKEHCLPDFQLNDNFVKLYELKIVGNISLAELFFRWDIPCYSKQLFLSNLLTVLSKDVEVKDSPANIIKQAIKEADWKI